MVVYIFYRSRTKWFPKLKMVSNKKNGPGALHLDVSTNSNLYVINAEDVPSLSAPGTEILAVTPEYLHR